MKMTLLLTDVGSPVAYYADLVPFIKNINATLLFCQLMYWMKKGKDPNGWVYKTSKDLREETGLTKDQQETARKVLKAMDIVEEKRKRIPPVVHFRIKGETLKQKWEEYRIKRGDSPQLKRQKKASRKNVDNPTQAHVLPAYITESTSETTQKSTPKMQGQPSYSSYQEEKEQESRLKEGRSQTSNWETIGKILRERKSP